MERNKITAVVLGLLLVIVLGGCGEKPMEGTPWSVLNLTGTLPDGWSGIPPANSLRSSQLKIAPTDGDVLPGEVIVYFIGPAEKNVEDSLSRWASQFEGKYGDPIRKEDMNREEFRANSMKFIMVHFAGTMARYEEPGIGEVPTREDWMCVAGVALTPSGPFFFKGTGPVKTMTAQVPQFKQFLKSLKYTSI